MPGTTITPVSLLIAGIHVRLLIREDLLDPPMNLYRTSAALAPPRFELAVTDDLPLQSGRPAGGPATLERCGRELRLSAAHFEGCLDWTVRRGTLRQPPGTRFHRVALQLILARELLGDGALLIHGCGLAAPAGGILCSGPSGSGKSTVAALAGWPVLGDELCAIGPAEGGGAWLAGTPLGASADARTLPLTGMFLLEPSPVDRVEPLPAPEAIRRLLEQAVTGGFDEIDIGRALAIAVDILSRRPLRRLRFTLGPRFRNLLARGEA